MTVCEHCKCRHGVVWSEQWLCPACEKNRIEILKKKRDAKEQSAAASGLADASSHPTPTETSEHVDGAVPRTDHEGTSSPNHEGTSSPDHDDPSASVQGEDTTTDKPTKAAPKAGASRSHRSHSQSTNHPDGPHCIQGCKHRKGRGGGDMVRCCLCMAWYHIKCLEISNDETLGFWSCFVCRHLGDDLRTTNEKLDSLSSEMERAVTLFTRTLRETLTGARRCCKWSLWTEDWKCNLARADNCTYKREYTPCVWEPTGTGAPVQRQNVTYRL